MNIKDYSTEELRYQRDYLQELGECGIMDSFHADFSLCDIINELTERERHVKIDRIPCWDTDPHTENAFL